MTILIDVAYPAIAMAFWLANGALLVGSIAKLTYLSLAVIASEVWA